MKSKDVTVWQIVKHILGVHTWSETRTWRNPKWGPNSPPVVYQNCELCGRERIRRYNGTNFYWEKQRLPNRIKQDAD